MSDWGGRAMCPREEYNDPALREEMCWHALEEALTEWADGNPRALPSLSTQQRDVLRAAPWERLPVGGEVHCAFGFTAATWRATTDSHLGPDSSGLVDLTCTLTEA